MADNSWWFNRAGAVAPVSNPGSAVPNYGLTLDVATAPWDRSTDFRGMADALGGAIQRQRPRPRPQLQKPEEAPSLWDRITGAGQWAVDTAQAGVGAAASGITSLDQMLGTDTKDSRRVQELRQQAEKQGLTGAKKYEYISEQLMSGEMAKSMKNPAVGGAMKALNTANEYAASTFLYGSMNEEDLPGFFTGRHWREAREMQRKGNWNAGEAFVGMAFDKETLTDEDRMEKIRQHNTLFNVSALTFNVIAGWKADPTVLAGKGLGAAAGLRAGRLAEKGAAAGIQRDILAAPNRATAEKMARNAGTMANRVRANHALSLFDKAQEMREAAKTMGFEDFKNLSPFKNSASGTVMAKLMKDVAHNDDEWNLVFRTAIGDQSAIGDLVSLRGEVADKISAIEARTLPHLEKQLERTQARYDKRLAEQGVEDKIEITRYGDWLLDNDLNTLKADVEDARSKLAMYDTHESWLQRALPGFDVETGELSGRSANAIFGNLEQVSVRNMLGRPQQNPFTKAGRDARASLYDLGGKVSTWQHDDYSPVSRLFKAPAKPFLKRVGVVSLNDVDEGGQAIDAYLDQIAYVTKANDQRVRDSVMERWAGSRTDVERRDIVQTLEQQAVSLLGRKYGLSSGMMDRLASHLVEQRKQAWGKMSDQSIYTTVKGKNGKSLHLLPVEDAHGNLNNVKMPMDPSELPNWHPLTNLTDLDSTIREHRDLLREWDKTIARAEGRDPNFSAMEAGSAKVQRTMDAFYNSVGETLNGFWKPLALISLRWPTRVVADESFRIMLLTGVLPHMKAWGEGMSGTVYNQGVVRAREWWNGRQIKTGSLAEDSLRVMEHQFDPYDARQFDNPTGAAPARALDFDKIDKKRYAKLNEETSKKWGHLRAVEASQRQTELARKQGDRMAQAVEAFTTPSKPRWVQQWDDRLTAAEQSDSRGFFFDPATDRTANKGFAVSVYPGRLKTFGQKPTAREMTYWTEKNSDLLAIKGNRAAVWLDKETGRWHMDVVKTTKRREDAMLLASDAEAPDFYDINDGFTRYVSQEDPYGHYSSPFVKPQAEPQQGFDRITVEKVRREDTTPAIAKKGVGFGKRKWRSADGKVAEGEAMYGLDKRDPNIYYSTTSSQNMFQNLFGGHTRGLGQNRARRASGGYKVFEPGDEAGSPEAKQWAEAWSTYVNNHIRQSPIWKRMLNGQTDEQIESWLRSAGGRELRVRMGPRGQNPRKWVSDMRAIYDHTLPTAEARRAALVGEVDPNKVDDLIPHEMRNDVHGQAIEMAAGTHDAQKMWFNTVDRLYKMLGSMPTDALVRHPFASNMYDIRMRNYLASVPADEITDKVMKAAEASARAFAVKQTRRLLYNIADEMEGVHMLRFVSPFFQAQLEVLERYAHIFTRKPESLARTLMLFNQSQTVNTSLFQVVDKDGKPAKGYDKDNQVIFQVTPFMRKIAHHIPGLEKALDNAGTVSVPVASMNLILQGENPFLPSAGPLVSIPASEFYFKDRPWKSEGDVYKWLFPFGTPDGGSALSRTGKAMSPAWLRRMYTAVTADFNDSAFANRGNIIYQDMHLAWEKGGKEGPEPTEKDALEAAKNEYMLRAVSSFVMPVPVTPRSPHQFWLDQGRAYRDKYGIDAGEKFYNDFGSDAFAYFVESSKSTNGLAPTSGAAKGYLKNKKLVDQAPDLAGVLAGPFGSQGDFNDAVYQWELQTRRSPLSKQHMREIKDPAERIKDVEIDRGWIEYGKLSSAVDAELRRRGLTSLENTGAEDLKFWRDQEVEGIISRNQAWSDAYQSRTQKTGAWLQQAYRVAFDKSLDNRTDIQGLRAYLVSRAKMQDTLQGRQQAGLVLSDSLSAQENADLAAGWQSYTRELVSKNLLFAEIYHRYLENDDLSVYVPTGGN